MAWAAVMPRVAGAEDERVTALGRLQPRGGVIRVAAPYSLQGPSIITHLPVGTGRRVEAGAVLALTHTHGSAQAALRAARAEVAVRKARLHVVESGLKPAELAALGAEAARERAEFAEASQQWVRSQRLKAEGSISAQELENAEARHLAASNRVVSATQRLAAGAEVRDVDVALARAEVQAAEAAAELAERELAQTEIRAPTAGEVLAVHARVGELALEGLLDFGDTSVMEVKAEVYESDVRHLQSGRRAEVSGDAFDGVLGAEVKEIGRQVRPNRLLHSDPAAFADNRVVEVILELDSATSAAALSGALVRVRFSP